MADYSRHSYSRTPASNSNVDVIYKLKSKKSQLQRDRDQAVSKRQDLDIALDVLEKNFSSGSGDASMMTDEQRDLRNVLEVLSTKRSVLGEELEEIQTNLTGLDTTIALLGNSTN